MLKALLIPQFVCGLVVICFGTFIANARPTTRSMPMAIQATCTRGGFVPPYSRVDVVSVNSYANGDAKTETILRDILVLVVAEPAPDARFRTVTVEVTPEQAERLSVFKKIGAFYLVLKSWVFPVSWP